MPPSFADEQYWDDRFQKNDKVFDWLLPETCFDESIQKFVGEGHDAKEVLHIGSGTSSLSFHLHGLLPDTAVITNVDFSHQAVEWGRRKAEQLVTQASRMRFKQVSLLILESLFGIVAPNSIDLIIDKSTTDAIACGPDIKLPGLLVNTPDVMPKLHPVNMLALNLAIVANSGSRWLCMSYSSERFPFIPSPFSSCSKALPSGCPDPGHYWRLMERKEIQDEQETNPSGQTGDAVVHRPITSNYLYVLERTEEKLETEQVLALASERI